MKIVQIRNFFWSVFSHIRTEYGEILRISPYSAQMQENTNLKKLRIWTLFTQWLWKNTERRSQKLYYEVFCKTTEMCSAKMLKGILKICGEFFCKTAETFFTKSLNHVLQKYWQVVCKNTEKCFVKILRSVFYKNIEKLLQNCLGEFHALTQMNKFVVKTQELSLFPVTSWPSFF